MTWKINPTLMQRIFSLIVFIVVASLTGCGTKINYSFTGTSTTASTISITEFYNNADLGQANLGQVFTNELKNYFIQNSSLKVVTTEGELQIEGEITDIRLTPIAPVNSDAGLSTASSTRVTITVRATYINTLDEEMNFKDKTFSFFKDLPNEVNFADVEEQYTREIFNRIINDIFNASVANW